MRTCFSVLFLIIGAIAACASESRFAKRGGLSTGEKFLAKVAPTEYAHLQRARAVGEQETAEAALRLLRVVASRWDAERTKADYDYDVLDAYAAAWALCLKIRKASSDPGVKAAILEEWNKNLKSGYSNLPLQLAVSWHPDRWERELLGPDFWQLLSTTTDRKILIALCWTLYEVGTLNDSERLQKKLDVTSELELQGILHQTMAWIKYKHLYASDPNSPGPNRDLPRLEID